MKIKISANAANADPRRLDLSIPFVPPIGCMLYLGVPYVLIVKHLIWDIAEPDTLSILGDWEDDIDPSEEELVARGWQSEGRQATKTVAPSRP
jgi:hypothetical protein